MYVLCEGQPGHARLCYSDEQSPLLSGSKQQLIISHSGYMSIVGQLGALPMELAPSGMLLVTMARAPLLHSALLPNGFRWK